MYNDAYHQALKDGKAKNQRIPVMIVGQDRAGKTSLMKHLLGLPFNSEEPSTVGIELEVIELTEQNSEEPWQKKREKQLMVRQEEAKDQILRQVAEMATKAPAKPDEEYRGHGLPESKTYQEEYPKTVTYSKESVSLSSDDVEKVALLTETTVDVEASSGIRVFVHDLSGQSIFYETHHHFLKLHCPYVVVHDLTKPLDEPAHPRFKSKLTGNEVDLQNPFLVTNLDYLLMWLAALDNLGGCEKEKLTSFALPPVLIALTNCDQFEGDVEAVKQRIKEVVRKRAAGNVFVEPFIINNASPERSGVVIRNLRKKLFELCKEILDKQPEFPINWLNLEVAFGQILSEKRNYVSIEEARNVARECNVKRFDDAVAFLHRQGSIVCPTGSNHVVLNPPFLMNLFTDIITVPEEEQAINSPYFQKLREHGILMREFLLNHRHGKLLEELMMRFSLICPFEREGESAYLVPSVAPIMAKGKEIEGILSTSPIAALYIAFRNSHLPPGVFVRVLVMLMNQCRGELSGQQPKLYCNYCLVSFKFHEGNFCV